MLYNRQQANFGTCYIVAQAYSLEQQNAGRAHAELCHASSYSALNWCWLISSSVNQRSYCVVMTTGWTVTVCYDLKSFSLVSGWELSEPRAQWPTTI